MSEATPIAAWRDIAKSAYKAYTATTNNKNHLGKECPAWEDLPQAIRTAWEAAVRQVDSISLQGTEILPDGSRQFPDEQRWRGWKSPDEQ